MELVAQAAQLVPDFQDHLAFNSFNADKKRIFLELFSKNPNITACAEACGVVRQTVFYAAERDAAFRAAFEAVKEGLTDGLEAKVLEFGQRPQNFMDRIAWLRARRPEVWAPKPEVQASAPSEIVVRLAGTATQYIDATVVPTEATTNINNPPSVKKTTP